MAKQPKIFEEKLPKKRRIRLRDLAPRKEVIGGAAKNEKEQKSSTVPSSLEDFLGRDSLRIDS